MFHRPDSIWLQKRGQILHSSMIHYFLLLAHFSVRFLWLVLCAVQSFSCPFSVTILRPPVSPDYPCLSASSQRHPEESDAQCSSHSLLNPVLRQSSTVSGPPSPLGTLQVYRWHGCPARHAAKKCFYLLQKPLREAPCLSPPGHLFRLCFLVSVGPFPHPSWYPELLGSQPFNSPRQRCAVAMARVIYNPHILI